MGWEVPFPSHQLRLQNGDVTVLGAVANSGAKRGLANGGLDDSGTFKVEKMLMISHMSGVMGTRNPSTHQQVLDSCQLTRKISSPTKGLVFHGLWMNGKKKLQFSTANITRKANQVPTISNDCGNRRNGTCSRFDIQTNSGSSFRRGLRVAITPHRIPCGGDNRNDRKLACFVATKAAAGDAQESPALAEELKDQLEAWQEEALHVRDRYNSARARFMRLTEVAQQLRQRAGIDMQHGDEESARKVLEEKRKVMRAAELSKRRAQLLEELSTKLGEAISKKETQLLVALASPRVKDASSDEMSVRVVPPNRKSKSSFVLQLDEEDDLADQGTSDSPHSDVDRGPTDSRVRDVSSNGSREQDDSNYAEVYVKEDKRSVASKATDGLQFEKKDIVGKSKDNDTGHPSVDHQVQSEDFIPVISGDDGEAFPAPGISDVAEEDPDFATATNFEAGSANSEKGIPDEGVYAGNSDLLTQLKEEYRNINNEEHLSNGYYKGRTEGGEEEINVAQEDLLISKKLLEESSGQVNFYDGGSLLFEDYILDIDQTVAAVESKLRIFMVTAVSREKGTCDERLRLVGELLEHVQMLRTRISQAVRKLP